MSGLYERPNWLQNGKNLERIAPLFVGLSIVIGVIGLITAIVLLVMAFQVVKYDGVGVLIGPIVIAAHSALLILFALMLGGLCKVVLAIFEMSVAETRDKIESQDASQ